MKRIFLTTLIVVLTLSSFSQSDTISMQKVFGGYKFMHQNKYLTVGQLVDLMKNNDAAFNQITSAQAYYNVAMIFSCTGGALIGFPIGTALGGGKPNWTFAAVGAGCILVTIPLAKQFNIKAKNAVTIYNDSLLGKAVLKDCGPKINLSFAGSGVSLKVIF